MKKNITKNSLLQLRGVLASFKTVGIDPRHAAALVKLWRLSSKVAEEVTEEQKVLMEKFGIAMLPDSEQLDPASEHFGEYLDAFRAIIEENIDLAEYCVLTFEEACIATAAMDLPLPDKDFIVELLTAEGQ